MSDKDIKELAGMQKIEFTDQEFGEYLKNKDPDWTFHSYKEYNKFIANMEVVAIVRYKNDYPVARKIWILKEDAERLEKGEKIPKIYDHRSLGDDTRGRFEISTVESVEHAGRNHDYVVDLKSGDRYLFRCSYCITFEKGRNGKYYMMLG